jgi:hypothetical protein
MAYPFTSMWPPPPWLDAKVAHLPPGPEKDRLLEKISQLETACHITKWLSSLDCDRPTETPQLPPPRRPERGGRETKAWGALIWINGQLSEEQTVAA